MTHYADWHPHIGRPGNYPGGNPYPEGTELTAAVQIPTADNPYGVGMGYDPKKPRETGRGGRTGMKAVASSPRGYQLKSEVTKDIKKRNPDWDRPMITVGSEQWEEGMAAWNEAGGKGAGKQRLKPPRGLPDRDPTDPRGTYGLAI